MHIGEDPAKTGKNYQTQHQKIQDGARDFGVNVSRQDNGSKQEYSSHDHDVGRGEGRFAGAVGTSANDEEFVKYKISYRNKRKGEKHPPELGVYLTEGFAADQLDEAKYPKNSQYGD